MTAERIAELRALVDAATPGPWENLLRAIRVPSDPPFEIFVGDEDDVDFIAAARTALPEALDAIERVRALCKAEDDGSSYAEDYMRTVSTTRILAALEGKSEPPKMTLQERYDRFVTAAKPGVTFVNEYKRRSTILGVDTTRRYRSIEDGPFYDVMVEWTNAGPSEESMPWYMIGEPEKIDE